MSISCSNQGRAISIWNIGLPPSPIRHASERQATAKPSRVKGCGPCVQLLAFHPGAFRIIAKMRARATLRKKSIRFVVRQSRVYLADAESLRHLSVRHVTQVSRRLILILQSPIFTLLRSHWRFYSTLFLVFLVLIISIFELVLQH